LDHGKASWYLYQEFAKKTGSFAIWKNPLFWEKWFEIESKEVNNSYSNKEDYYFFLLISIATNMQQLNIELPFVISCVVEKVGKKYLKNVSLKLFNSII
jgi:hypothetical protein